MKLKYVLIGFAICVSQFSFSQSNVSYSTENYSVGKNNTLAPKNSTFDWHFELQNLEAPFQGNGSYQFYLNDLKKEIEKRYPRKDEISSNDKSGITANLVSPPIQTDSFEGNLYSGSVPNDNSMAISNAGIVVSAINTNLIFYNTNTKTLLKTISLESFSDTINTVSVHQYDPKIIYDYLSDKFIVVFLAGTTHDSTHIIVAFSTTSNPMDNWNFYSLKGNPLNDTSWTDFPTISLSNNELFITGNLLKDGGSWQTSFKQSVIWQIDKSKGYAGDSLITKLYYNIKFGNTNLRNLHAVVGGESFYGPHTYFLSNRNFALQNDSIFLLKTSGAISSNPTLTVKCLKSNKNYGAPPNARQAANKNFATNDARVLAAFFQNNQIQMVGNTIDTTGGKARIYHARIDAPDTATVVKLNILKDSITEFGYPNISYCGNKPNSHQSIITFNYTGTTTNAGFGTIFYNQNDEYSNFSKLKEGETYIAILLGASQRWGDYSGSQPRYNESGKVWVSGTFGKLVGSSRRYGTWICELSNTMTNLPSIKEEKPNVLMFPNPVNEEIVNLEFELNTKQNISIDVYDLQGKHLYKMFDGMCKIGHNALSFSTLNLKSGIYIVKISTNSGELISKKLNVIH